MCITDKSKSDVIERAICQFFWEVFNSVVGNGVGLEIGGGAFSSLRTQMLLEGEGSFLHCKCEAVMPFPPPYTLKCEFSGVDALADSVCNY